MQIRQQHRFINFLICFQFSFAVNHPQYFKHCLPSVTLFQKEMRNTQTEWRTAVDCDKLPPGLMCGICLGRTFTLKKKVIGGVEKQLCEPCYDGRAIGERMYETCGSTLKQFVRQHTSEIQTIIFGCIRMSNCYEVQPGSIESLRHFITKAR